MSPLHSCGRMYDPLPGACTQGPGGLTGPKGHQGERGAQGKPGQKGAAGHPGGQVSSML